jgi:hypothetical protein
MEKGSAKTQTRPGWLERGSIYDVLSRARKVRSEQELGLTGDALLDVQLFIRNPARCPKNPFVRFIFDYFLNWQSIKEIEQELRRIFASCSSIELVSEFIKIATYLDKYRSLLNSKWLFIHDPIDYASLPCFQDSKFGVYMLAFVVTGWEMAKRLELAKNPEGYKIDTPTALSFFNLWTNKDRRKKLNSLAYKALGIDNDAELLKDLTEAAKRVDSADWERALDFLQEELLRRGTEELSSLSDIKRTVKAIERDEYFELTPHAAYCDLINTWEKSSKEISANLQLIESFSDISRLSEDEKASDLTRWTEKLRDPIDREIARLRFRKDFAIRKIAEKLSLSKSDVDRRIKKLKPPS